MDVSYKLLKMIYEGGSPIMIWLSKNNQNLNAVCKLNVVALNFV